MKQDSLCRTTSAAADADAEHRSDDGSFKDVCERVGRLEAMLAATGGTLHDVNNLLTVLSGNLYLMTESVRDDPQLLSQCRNARNTAQRAGTLIRELLSFGRSSDQVGEVICPAQHVAAMEAILQRGMGGAHQIEVDCDEEPWHARASIAQLESAVANLTINAKEAMSAGTIRISVRNVTVENAAGSSRPVASGSYVCIEVADDGPGIPADILPQVTKPLYTNKAPGKGNGMGLAMVESFATNASGYLTIDSREGSGTRVTIWLPREAPRGDATASMTTPIATLPAGDETVLLVTDDSDARSTMAHLLDALGYSVLQSGERTDALRIAETRDDLALVISERSMANAADRKSVV